MGKLFGTDGVRGIANKELTCELSYNLGKAGAYVLTSETKHKPKILVGMDTRISGDMLENALIAGLCSAGAQAICIGVIPTPAVAHLTRLYNADAGVMISASHNPYEFNGIKFFNGNGNKLHDLVEDKIEDYILNNMDKIPQLTGEDIGSREFSTTASLDYINFLKSTTTSSIEGLKIVLDCANGAAYKIGPKIFRDLNANIVVINDTPDGININENCGSTHVENLKEHILSHNADMGLAFDGDADRVLAMDEKGNVVDGDKIMAILGIDLKNSNKLNNNTIVSTVMSNLGLDITCKKENLALVKTKVGDRYVLEEMMANGYSLGGEQSGHIILLDHNTTGDGILTGLKLASIIKSSGSTLSSLASVLNILPQVLLNAKVKNEHKDDFSKDPIILSACQEIQKELNGEGRLLIRPSGTEPLVRVMIEGKKLDYINSKATEMVTLIENRLN